MSKPDIDFSKYVKVPESWINNALDIPNTVKSEPKVTFLPRNIIAAAGIVLVTMLGISLYFLSRNISPAQIAPGTVEPTAATASAFEPFNMTAQPTEPPVKDEPSSSKAGSAVHSVTEGASTAATSPTAPTPTAPPHSLTPTAPQLPTSVYTWPEPTQMPSPKPTAVSAPTQARTDAPSPTAARPTTSSPTQAPATQAGDDVPEEEPSYIEIALPLNELELIMVAEDSEDMYYCRVYDSRGNMLGSGDLYSSDHIASVVTLSGTPHLYYTIERLVSSGYTSDHTSPERFTYQFYLRSGAVICTDTIYIK